MHGSGKGATLRAYVSYLARDGKVAARGESGLECSVDYLQRADTRGNERFAFYDRSEIGVDGEVVTAGWAEDSGHFRLIMRLDRLLAGEAAHPEGEGVFARQYTSALQQRRLFLIEPGGRGWDQAVLPQSTLSRTA